MHRVPALRFGSTLAWRLSGDPLPETRAAAWVDGAARAVAAWSDGLPTDVELDLVGERGASVRFGEANAGDPPTVRVWVGRDAAADTLRDDWVLVHELLHTGFPSLPQRSRWLAEGMATYAEPLARAAGGLRAWASAWNALRNSLPQGEPLEGDGGLEGNRSWAATYWGGALWCFAADVRLRQATKGAKGPLGFREATARLGRAGGTMRARWSAKRTVAALDDLTATSVFGDLYDEHAADAVPFGFDALWKDAIAVGLAPAP